MRNIEDRLIKLHKKYQKFADECDIDKHWWFPKGVLKDEQRRLEMHWFYQGRAEAMWEVINILRGESPNENQTFRR